MDRKGNGQANLANKVYYDEEMIPQKQLNKPREQPRFNSMNRSGDVLQETDSFLGRHNKP